MDIVVVIISVSRDHEAVMLGYSGPPPKGGWTVMANGKHRRPGKSLQTVQLSGVEYGDWIIILINTSVWPKLSSLTSPETWCRG